MSYQNLKTLICSVCSEWLSLDELSAIVRRDKIYLRNFIIPKMLEDNSLEMLFPGVPNHPRQKYKNTHYCPIKKDNSIFETVEL